jgi:hypothetical protein
VRPDDMLELLRRRPFGPFRIHLSNGQSYDIRHPEVAFVTRAALVLGIPAPDLPPEIADRATVVALIHINNIEPLPVGAAAVASGNGH